MTAQQPERADIQGNILNPYTLPVGHFQLLWLPSADSGRNIVRALLDRITTADRHGELTTALNIAITFAGFERLGIAAAYRQQFPAEFCAPPEQTARRLGDSGVSDPSCWPDRVEERPAHLLISVHAIDSEHIERVLSEVRAVVEQHAASVVTETRAWLRDGRREHFGYADGGAQPDVEAVTRGRRGRLAGGGVPRADGSWQQVRLGEFVLGYLNEDGERSTAPLERNGSYLVLRKLAQDVAKFHAGLKAAAALTGMSEELVAAKVVGRWRDGKPLVKYPDYDPPSSLYEAADEPDNDFRYLPADRYGFDCPIGAHIRRVNPRDALTFLGAVDDAGRLTARHRIIRRGMPYGPDFADDPRAARGLLFLGFNANIARQFETLQLEWCNNGNAFGLGADTDYVIGPARAEGKMTIPRRDARPALIPTPTDLVVTTWSEYLLTPGINVLWRLAHGGFGNL